MTFNYPASGLNNTAEYIASGLPWVTSSVVTTVPATITFPMVTNEVVVANSGSNVLRIGFTVNGVNGSNYYTLLAQQSVTLNVRTTKMYFRSDVGDVSMSIYAGLTMIPGKNMPVLTGSAYYNPSVTASLYGYATGLG